MGFVIIKKRSLLIISAISFLQVISYGQFNTLRSGERKKVSNQEKTEIVCESIIGGSDKKVKALAFDTSFYPVAGIPFDTTFSLTRHVYFLPLKNITENSTFGIRIHPILGGIKFHAGVDLKAKYEQVYSIATGIVEVASFAEKEGFYVVIKHNNIKSIYCHLAAIIVRKGDYLLGGSCIGISGSTGLSTGPHLHFGMKVNDHSVDPSIFLRNIGELNAVY